MRLDVVPLPFTDGGCGKAEFARMTGNEQPENLGNIRASFGQRRERDLHRAEPVPQRIAWHGCWPRAVIQQMRYDDTDVEPARPFRADWQHLAGFNQR